MVASNTSSQLAHINAQQAQKSQDQLAPLQYQGKVCISAEKEAEIRQAFATLYGAVATYMPDTTAETMANDAGRKAIAQCAIEKLQDRRRALRESAFAKVRQAIGQHFTTAIKAFDVGRAEYDKLSPMLKGMIPAFPSEVKVPVSELTSFFGEGATEAEVVKVLHDRSFKLSDGRAKGPLCVVLDSTEQTKYREVVKGGSGTFRAVEAAAE